LADAVAQIELMMIARPAAGAIVFSIRKRVGKDAMLHVEHGHVLVDHDLEKCWIDSIEQRPQLIPVEII